MRVSTLSGVTSIGGIAEAVWAAAKWGNASTAQTVTAVKDTNCFMACLPYEPMGQHNVTRLQLQDRDTAGSKPTCPLVQPPETQIAALVL